MKISTVEIVKSKQKFQAVANKNHKSRISEASTYHI